MSVNRRSITRVGGNPPAASGPKYFSYGCSHVQSFGQIKCRSVQHSIRPRGKLLGQLISQFPTAVALRDMLNYRPMFFWRQLTGRCQRDGRNSGAGGGFRSSRWQMRDRFLRTARRHWVPIAQVSSGVKTFPLSNVIGMSGWEVEADIDGSGTVKPRWLNHYRSGLELSIHAKTG